MQVSQSRQKLWKEWHFISQSMTQPAEVTCMVVVTLELPTVAKAQYTHLTSSKAHIYKIETSGNPYSGLKRPSQSFRIQKHPKCSVVARGGVQWEVFGTHSDVQW